MTAIIHLIFRHPRVHENLMKALEEAVGEDEFPRHDQIKDIPYLQATIDEGYVYFFCLTCQTIDRSFQTSYICSHYDWPTSFGPRRWCDMLRKIFSCRRKIA
jgi:hypothetical protein